MAYLPPYETAHLDAAFGAGSFSAGAESVGLGAGPVDDAATSRGWGKTAPHSLNGRLVAIATEARSSRFVDDVEQQFCFAMVDLDVSRLIEAEQVQAPVASHDTGGDAFVGGFDELVNQLSCGDVAVPAAG